MNSSSSSAVGLFYGASTFLAGQCCYADSQVYLAATIPIKCFNISRP